MLLLLPGCFVLSGVFANMGSDDEPEDSPAEQTTTIGFLDADGDGAPADSDCGPREASRFPGAEEVCNGEDDDCDALVDARVTIVVFAVAHFLCAGEPGCVSWPAVDKGVQV